jgi:chromosomal replication initiation ATPase DnaA
MFKEDILEMTNDIQSFKETFENKYKKNISILVSDKSDVVFNVRQWEDEIQAMKEAHQVKTIEILEKLVLGTMRTLYPEFRMRSLGKECRKREFVIFKQLFCYMCNKMGFTLQYTGSQINKHHASVLHSIRQVEGLLKIKDPQLCEAYEKLKENIRNYVRTIPEDVKRQAYTEPITSLVWD